MIPRNNVTVQPPAVKMGRGYAQIEQIYADPLLENDRGSPKICTKVVSNLGNYLSLESAKIASIRVTNGKSLRNVRKFLGVVSRKFNLSLWLRPHFNLPAFLTSPSIRVTNDSNFRPLHKFFEQEITEETEKLRVWL